MILCEVKNVSLDMGGKRILNNVNLTINENETIGLIGESGSGKSVLMWILRGVEGYAPTEGKIIFHVAVCPNPDCHYINLPSFAKACPRCKTQIELKDIDFWDPSQKVYHDAIKNRIAIMFQRSFTLFGQRTVLENIIASLEAIHYPAEMRVKRAAEMVSAVGLSHRITHVARDLSGGEKQRVVLARQIAVEPMLLLLDEPTGTLDPITARKIYNFIGDIQSRTKLTMMVASHLPYFIVGVAPRSFYLENGKVVVEGTTKDLVDRFMAKVKPIERSHVEFGPPIIECKDIKKYYYTSDRGLIKAVDGATFTIKEKMIYAMLGRSGAGKTSVAHIISGHPSVSGYRGLCTVRIGNDVFDMSKPGPDQRGRAKKYIGMSYQEYDLFAFKNILENLRGAIPETPDELAEGKVVDLLKVLAFHEGEIPALLKKSAAEISEGEKQRILIALALIKDPKIVLLDEPTGTLDLITMQPVIDTVKSARDKLGTTFLIISHDIEFVKRVCDEVTVMKEGKSIFTGPPDEAIEIAIEKKAF